MSSRFLVSHNRLLGNPALTDRDPSVSSTPPITVALPTMNGAAHLAETLHGVLRQSGVDFDLLVCDDRSEDATVELVTRTFGDRARVHVNSERLGLAGNWNQCVALSRTPTTAILHQDDVWLPGHLAGHTAAFAANAEVGLVASASEVIDERGRPVPPEIIERGGLGPTDRVFDANEALLAMAASNPFRCSAVSIRVDVHQALGGFDSAWRYVVDWDFWLRAARSAQVSWLASPSVLVRWHDASETHRFARGTLDLEETDRLVTRTLSWLRDSPTPTPIAPIARAHHERLARAYLNRAYVALKRGLIPLSRRCLFHALRSRPTLLGTILADPRLSAQLALMLAAPPLAIRWFAREASTSLVANPENTVE